MDVLDRINKQLIVSCQALEDEPLHDSYIMGKMAFAASLGGALFLNNQLYTGVNFSAGEIGHMCNTQMVNNVHVETVVVLNKK